MFFTAAADLMPVYEKTLMNSGSSSSSWVWMTVVPLGVYSALALVSNAVDCVNFVVVWNTISRTSRTELTLVLQRRNAARRRRQQMKKALNTKSYSDIFFPKDETCPICLQDFQGSDRISSFCEQNKQRFKHKYKMQSPPPCFHMFHDGCLTAWLEKHTNCPCCRYEMLPFGADEVSNTILIPYDGAFGVGNGSRLGADDLSA